VGHAIFFVNRQIANTQILGLIPQLQILRLLAVAALWVRIQTCFKNTKWAAEAKGLHSSHHEKQYEKILRCASPEITNPQVCND
jgi:hypothetical protein